MRVEDFKKHIDMSHVRERFVRNVVRIYCLRLYINFYAN